MLLKNIKITFPLKEDGTDKKPIVRKDFSIVKERRNPVVKSDLKSVNDYGRPIDIGRLVFRRIPQR